MITVAFVIGLGAGWFGATTLTVYQSHVSTTLSGLLPGSHRAATPSGSDSTVTLRDADARLANARADARANGEIDKEVSLSSNPQLAQQQAGPVTNSENAGRTISDVFTELLKDRRYDDAMALFEEQEQLGTGIVGELRSRLLKELSFLMDVRNNSDFSDLMESYLSIYYDDIDALILLADFNQSNGSFLEVIDVYLLAKTYAYSNVDRQKVINRFNNFVEVTDNSFTAQKDWWYLINFYSHISTSGLMTSVHQYRQALAHLRGGDEAFAVSQFNELLNDALVGESAALALNSITGETDAPVVLTSSPFEGADSITLQKIGNQFSVDLNNSRQDSVKLLIDTGASMTAVSKASFNTLNANGDAVAQERRVFHTANGPIMGTVYVVPEISLGPHLLEDTQVAVIDFPGDRGIDGLLGMNILGQFRFHIEQESSRLLLSRK